VRKEKTTNAGKKQLLKVARRASIEAPHQNRRTKGLWSGAKKKGTIESQTKREEKKKGGGESSV